MSCITVAAPDLKRRVFTDSPYHARSDRDLGEGFLRHTTIPMLTGQSPLQPVNRSAALKIEQSHSSSGE